jgi:hypothetical protein
MSDSNQSNQLFLLDQQIMRLKDDVPFGQRRYRVCGDERPAEKIVENPWESMPRFTDEKVPKEVGIVELARSEEWRRVALMCDAGLGKTTNLRWLQRHLCEPGSRILPLLIPLDEPAGRILLQKERESGDILVRRLARQIMDAAKGKLKTHLRAVERMQSAGRVVLLIDGLDHAIANPETATMLKELIESAAWRGCPVWIAGRPYALSAAWQTLFNTDEWKFLRIGGLQSPEIRFYLARQAGADVYSRIPDESAHLFAVPRLLDLMSGIIKRELPAGADEAAQIETLQRLKLAAAADVYHLAYFHAGKYDDINSRGLLGQGLAGKGKRIGLKKGQSPDALNYETRLRRTAQILGAIAFEMYTMHANPERPQPNVEGIAAQQLGVFETAVANRLSKAGLGKRSDFLRDFDHLTRMNVSTVEYLVFRQSDKKSLAWHDRTVQAFFAAFWAMNYTTPEELVEMYRWRVVRFGDEDDWELPLQGYGEFWQFVAEMPSALIYDPNQKNWFAAIAESFTAPADLPSEDYFLKQWHRRMIYHGYLGMKQRIADTKPSKPVRDRAQHILNTWREVWLRLKNGKGSEKEQAIYETMIFCNCPPSLEETSFRIGSPASEDGRFDDEGEWTVSIKPFAMQDFPVTNAQFELFDPSHRNRCYGVPNEDRRPVEGVTFWDAVAYAYWTGNRLPRDAEWEFACRAGTDSPFSFGRELNGTQANCNGNYPYGTAKKGPFLKRSVAKDEQPKDTAYMANAWGLWHMHGNVWEWCDSHYSHYEPWASYRVLRGGCWDDMAEECRSAHRSGDEPVQRYTFEVGFRLAAVPCTVGAKPRQWTVGDVAAGVTDSM